MATGMSSADQIPVNVLVSYTDEVETEIIIEAVDMPNMTLDEPLVPTYANLDDASSSRQGLSPDSGYDDNSPPGEPKLVVEEEPEPSYRFRYLKESKKPHGPIRGECSQGKTPKNSTGPRVKLRNVSGEAVIRVWLYNGSEDGGPSPHELLSVVDKNGEPKKEPHDLIVNAKNDYTASFDKLNIVHVVENTKEYHKSYLRKVAAQAKIGDMYSANLPDGPTAVDVKELKKQWKDINKDHCSLYFEAFLKSGGAYYCVATAMSRVIKNKKSPKTNEPKIVRSNPCQGTVRGGDLVMIFTEKLVKGIRIFFTDGRGWKAEASFEEKDIHHQVAVAFKTPAYKDVGITEPVYVEFYIQRMTDNAISNRIKFRYMPDDDLPRKRPKPSPECPPVVVVPQDPMISGANVMPLDEYDFNRLELDLLERFDYEENDEPDDLDEVPSSDLMKDSIPLSELAGPSQVSPGFRVYMPWEVPFVGYNSTSLWTSLWPQSPDWLRQHAEVYAMFVAMAMVAHCSLGCCIAILILGFGFLSPGLIYGLVSAYCYERDSAQKTKGPMGPNTTSTAEKARRLHECIRNNRRDVSKFLTKETASFKIKSKTALHLAVQHERTTMVSKLLSFKADPYALDSYSNTPVHMAILSSLVSLQIILSSEPPLPVFNKDGDDPLLFAIRNNKIHAVKLLLGKGFSLDTSNVIDGDGPLHVALQIPDEGMRYDMVCRLLEANASLSKRNGAGLTALDVAKSRSQKEGLIEKLTPVASDGSGSEDEYVVVDGDASVEENLASELTELRLDAAEGEAASFGTDQEPYLALDGDVETSKKVAQLTQCTFLNPVLVNAKKQSQVLLKQLERKMTPREAVKTLNDAYTRAKAL